jgi:trimeric autotransporter adhesin
LPGTVAIAYAYVSAPNTITIGNTAQATNQNGVVLGFNSIASGTGATVIGNNSTTSGVNSVILGDGSSSTSDNTVVIGAGVISNQTNAVILGGTSANVGIGTTTPDTGANLDVNGTFKLGVVGTVTKNSVSFSGAVNVIVPFGLGSHFDITITIPGGRLSSTQATVAVSPGNDLPNGIFIAFARVLSTNQILLRLMNDESFSITVSGNFYFTITEF